MQALNVAFGASSTSNTFRVNSYGDFWVEMRSGGGAGFGGGTITMQSKPENGGSFATYTIDGAAETWTAADKRRYVDGGIDVRFVSDGSVSDVDIWFSGCHVVQVS